MNQIVLSNSLQSYILQINRLPLLSAEEEYKLAVRFKRYNDLEAAHKLITSNLRFVVKIAMEYKNYGFKVADLVQEGNIGLMKGVKKFDPYKGYRLITYAVWWIRSHIQAFILKNWSLVRKETAYLKKRLFYQFEKSRKALSTFEKSLSGRRYRGNHEQDVPDAEYRDLSLDNEIGDEETTHLEMLPDTSQNQEDAIAMLQEHRLVRAEVSNALQKLNEKERYVIKNRIMADPPLTLQHIGERLGVSRERIRQIEEQALKKLKQIKGIKALASGIQ